jgi:BirA family biotin operon repressor/biotin-[acetyl-CoA-carboxylase] ligase
VTWPAELVHLDEVDSTNTRAAALAREGAPHGTIVVARAQSAGRGTRGRHWWSPPGAGLYLSAIVRLDRPPASLPPLTLAGGVGVCDACRALGAAAVLKWPNDVLAPRGGDWRKLAGILVEAATRGGRLEYAILGVGLNVADVDPPPDVPSTSLARERGAPLTLDEALATLVPALDRAVLRFVHEGAPGVVRAWKERSPFFGRRISVRDGDDVIAGVLRDVDHEGALCLETDEGGWRRVRTGEVVL